MHPSLCYLCNGLCVALDLLRTHVYRKAGSEYCSFADCPVMHVNRQIIDHMNAHDSVTVFESQQHHLSDTQRSQWLIWDDYQGRTTRCTAAEHAALPGGRAACRTDNRSSCRVLSFSAHGDATLPLNTERSASHVHLEGKSHAGSYGKYGFTIVIPASDTAGCSASAAGPQ